MKPAIVITDFSSDVGDLGGVSMALAYHRLGHLNLLGIMLSTSHEKAGGAIDATRIYWGVPDGQIAIGVYKNTFDPGSSPGGWSGYIYDNYFHNLGLNASIPDAVSEIRRLLAARTTNDVILIELGPCNLLADLLDSTSDGYSSLSGTNLVAAKVKHLVIMGGYYPTNASVEWNFQQAPADANQVCTQWPTPIYFMGYEIGQTISNGTTLATNKPSGNLLRAAYYQAGYPNGRTAWDDMTPLAAAQGFSGFSLTRGSNSVNISTGVNTFTAGASGTHYYLVKVDSDAMFHSRLNTVLEADPSANPILSSWSSTAAWTNIVMDL